MRLAMIPWTGDTVRMGEARVDTGRQFISFRCPKCHTLIIARMNGDRDILRPSTDGTVLCGDCAAIWMLRDGELNEMDSNDYICDLPPASACRLL